MQKNQTSIPLIKNQLFSTWFNFLNENEKISTLFDFLNEPEQRRSLGRTL